MLKSMTGFGRCEVSEGERKITVEMKSVNHRYLDVTLKMPKKLNFFESAIRALLKEYIQRGKVDVFITYEDLSHKSAALSYNPAIAAQYMETEMRFSLMMKDVYEIIGEAIGIGSILG